MQPQTDPNPADILPKAIYYQIVHTLRGLLPAPVTDTPEDEARRDLALIARIAALLPATPEEADLAAQYVAASAWALDCLRLARTLPEDSALYRRCTAQSVSMMRQARGWRSALKQAQTERREREKETAERDAATATEQRALALAADALVQAPPTTPAPAEQPPSDPIV